MREIPVQPRQPRLRLLAAAAALAMGPALAIAQASGATAIHGQASIVTQGNQTTITTVNGAGTRHSAINWQSFSVAAGSSTRFNQPDASSTSINRVLGGDPSKILGTLSSNGRLVLVNPAGITVGAGASVDTAGFTASTLRMSEADALAGRLRFDGGMPGATLQVDGSVLAQSGDVVLISSNVAVGANALLRAPGGAVVLAAGQTVDITGRGLEGIRLELSAPSDSAVNLGTLEGDAVGIFASNLRHSGLLRAVGAETDGNKLRLVATLSSQVDGIVRVGSAKLVTATKLSGKDDKDAKDKADKDKADKEKADKEKADKDKKDKEEKDKKDKEAKRASANAGNGSQGENSGAGNSAPEPEPAPTAATTASAPAPAQASAGEPAAAPAPAPAAEATPAPSAPAPAAANSPAPAPATASSPAPAPSAAPAPAPTAAAPAPAPAAPAAPQSTAAAPQAPAQAVTQPVVVAAIEQQQQQVASALADPGELPVDARKKREKLAAAKDDALQCVP